MVLASQVRDGERTFCECVSTLVSYDDDAKCSRRLQEEELALLASHFFPTDDCAFTGPVRGAAAHT
jgi:hypothetical protein